MFYHNSEYPLSISFGITIFSAFEKLIRGKIVLTTEYDSVILLLLAVLFVYDTVLIQSAILYGIRYKRDETEL